MTAATESASVAAAPVPRRRRPRLVHVDAMRPVKQLGVVSTHSVEWFAPAGNLGAGGVLMITHMTRFAFMFISAAMLVYAYPELGRARLGVFWRRRLLAVVVPYVTWTLLYFVMGLVRDGGAGGVAGNARTLGYMLLTGYEQLYYLVLLLEFYIIYPLFLWLLRRTERHHWTLLAVSLAVQFVLTWLIHRAIAPGWMLNRDAIRELWNYQLFVVAGGVMAWHYHDVHDWICRHRRSILAATAGMVVVAESWYVLAARGVPGLRTSDPSAPFQPVEVLLYLGLVVTVYLLGVTLGDSRRPRRLRALVSAGADYSYGIYLSQVLFLTVLTALGWHKLDQHLPWPLVTAGGILLVYSASWGLTALLSRLPGARGTAGISRKRWRAADTTASPAAPSAPASTPG